MSVDRNYPAAMLRFQKACIEASKLLVDVTTPEESKRMQEGIYATLVLGAPSTPSITRKLTPAETYIQKLFYDYLEVSSSYEALLAFPILSGSRPRKGKLTECSILTFWREAYFNEFYILSCRMAAFVKRSIKAHRISANAAKLDKVAELLVKNMKAKTKAVNDLRGRHVHEVRLGGEDVELSRVRLLELLTIHGSMVALEAEYRAAVKACTRKTVKNFKAMNLVAKALLGDLFVWLNKLLLNPDGSLKLPPSK